MSHARGVIPNVRKIAVLRANAIGDFVFAQPALAALRSAYPQAEIILLGKAWHANYLDGRPGPVDRVVIIPRYRGVSEPDTWQGSTLEGQAKLDHFFAQMKAEQFDLALQMHGGGGNSNPFVHQLGARFTAGMRAPGAPPLDAWIPYFYWQHEILRLIEVAGLVGAPPVGVEPQIYVTERDLAESCQAAPETSRRMVVLHPGATDPRRRWPSERFSILGDALAQEGHQVILVGTPDEDRVVQAVQEKMHQPALNLCGKLSLHGLTGLLKRAALLVGNDSGPRHLAEAVGTPTVGIYWCGNLINAGSAFRSRHRPHLSWRLECPICGQNTIHNPCDHQATFVDGVQVEEVLVSALDLLEAPRDELEGR